MMTKKQAIINAIWAIHIARAEFAQKTIKYSQEAEEIAHKYSEWEYELRETEELLQNLLRVEA